MNYRVLATDYDGTIAHHGSVDAATIDALQGFKDHGGKLLLVTGREIPDLYNVFPEPRIFDLIIAENGALLHNPCTAQEKLLATPPPKKFSELLLEKGVQGLSIGRVIVATQEIYCTMIQNTIDELQLDLEIILNKGSLMVLPSHVDKGSGLTAGLLELGLRKDQVAGVGDAENDFSLLDAAGFKVAVANALPELKKRADFVTECPHGMGVRELIRKLLAHNQQVQPV